MERVMLLYGYEETLILLVLLLGKVFFCILFMNRSLFLFPSSYLLACINILVYLDFPGWL